MFGCCAGTVQHNKVDLKVTLCPFVIGEIF